MQARSPQLAALLASVLNGELVAKQSDRPSALPRYFVQPSASSPERRVVFGMPSTARDPARFGDGRIAATEDAELAERLSARMNDLDPESLKRVTRGPGWF